MMYIYILQSDSKMDYYYVGITKDVHKRLLLHNQGKVPQTKLAKPWKIKNLIWFQQKEKAIAFEQYLKTGSGRAFAKKHF